MKLDKIIKNFDLHMHSAYSKDGEYPPHELISIAKKANLQVVALCDHDSIQGVNEMVNAGNNENIWVIPGIECSTLFKGNECHLLGYGIDLNEPYFKELTAKINQLTHDAFHQRVVKLLNKYPIEIDEEKVIKDANGKNPWFNMMNDIFSNPKYQDIEDFKDYLPGGKRCEPAPVNFYWDKCLPGTDLYVRVEYPSLEDTVKKIHEAGGIAILAHPFKTFYQNEELLNQAIEAGIDGLEVYSNYHETCHNEYYEQFAFNHKLLVTCGSDFHGKNKPAIKMGEYGLTKDGSELIKPFLDTITNK